MLDQLINITTRPLVDLADVLQGLSEGELRERAIVSLGAEVVSGMAISEVINYLTEQEK
jgi:hypothetical protein